MPSSNSKISPKGLEVQKIGSHMQEYPCVNKAFYWLITVEPEEYDVGHQYVVDGRCGSTWPVFEIPVGIYFRTDIEPKAAVINSEVMT